MNPNTAPDENVQQPVKKKKKRSDFQLFMDFLDSLFEKLLIFMLIAVLICVWLQVLGRYISIVKPFPWTEEIARWLLVWLTFLGATHVAKSSSYTRVDFFVAKFPAKLQKVVGIFDKCCMLAFTGWFAYKSFVVFTTVSTHELGPTTQLPMIIMRAAGFTRMGISFLQIISAGVLLLLSQEDEEMSG